MTIPGSVTSIGFCAFWECERSFLIYLGGPLSNLNDSLWNVAAMGYIHAQKQGITEIDRWREGYLEYIIKNKPVFIDRAEDDRSVLLFMVREGLLDEDETGYFLEWYEDSDDVEAKSALLQYRHEKFGK